MTKIRPLTKADVKTVAGLEKASFSAPWTQESLLSTLSRADFIGYVFETEIEEGLFANVDELCLERAIYNLIGNAVNYTGEDKRVIVQLKRETEGFRLSVTDTGAGIKAEELNEIWDRYYRSEASHKRPVQGTGLGLSIVKTILERHQLQFGVTSEVGKGSTFYVCFPELP